MRRQGKLFTVLTALLVCGALYGSAAPATAEVPQARLLPDGRAVAPPSAPPAVEAMIEAANRIRHRPYKWGGGHGKWNDRGYDCSGSVSYVMHSAGLRWDTSYTDDGDRSGPGWSEEMRSTGGFRLRHPLGIFRTTPLG